MILELLSAHAFLLIGAVSALSGSITAQTHVDTVAIITAELGVEARGNGQHLHVMFTLRTKLG